MNSCWMQSCQSVVDCISWTITSCSDMRHGSVFLRGKAVQYLAFLATWIHEWASSLTYTLQPWRWSLPTYKPTWCYNFLFLAFLSLKSRKSMAQLLPSSAPFCIQLTFCLRLFLMCSVSHVTNHTFDRLQWRTKVVEIVEEESVSSCKAKTWSDWPWINHRCAVADFLCWVRFLEQLFWNLSKVVDKTNGSILL